MAFLSVAQTYSNLAEKAVIGVQNYEEKMKNDGFIA